MAGLGSLAGAIKPISDRRRSDVYLMELGSDGQVVDGTDRRFQHFPDTVSDSKAINYATKDIPGASLPLYQWVNSGARTISFTAVFTTDVDFVGGSSEPATAIGNMRERLKASGVEGDSVYIPAAILWLRRYMLPRYSEDEGTGVGTPLVQAPPTLILAFPKNARFERAGGTRFNCDASAIPVIMTTCDVSYEAFFPSGVPRIATVALSFAEVAQVGGSVVFPQAYDNFEQGGIIPEDEQYKFEPAHREESDGLLDDLGAIAGAVGF